MELFTPRVVDRHTVNVEVALDESETPRLFAVERFNGRVVERKLLQTNSLALAIEFARGIASVYGAVMEV